MEPGARNGFLEVDRLLESSEPLPRVNLTLWLAGSFLVVMLGTAILGRGSAEARQWVGMLSGLLMTGVVVGVSLFSFHMARQLRAEQQTVERIGELVQLRRWPEAAMALQDYLSRPARAPQFRTQALVYLAPVLVRENRFGDAIAVQSFLIDGGMVDAGGDAALRLGRTMAMLQEDHLFDADRAISELRRGPAAGSAALALVEIYRDVKTGHPSEAIDLFHEKQLLLRDQLGHRMADAYALVARACDLLGDASQAADHFKKATLLAPAGELFRRYPEVQKLEGRYRPAPAPSEAA